MGQNLRDHPIVALICDVREDHPQDPLAPRTQCALRYTASGSPDRNDIADHSVVLLNPHRRRRSLRAGRCAYPVHPGAGRRQGGGAPERQRSPCQPSLNYHYLEEQRDVERLREAVRISLQLLEHPSFASIIDKVVQPSPADLASDEALDDYMRRTVFNTTHASGTCKMGQDSDPWPSSTST